MLRLTGRYYRNIPCDRPGYEEEPLSLDPARTALIGMHCWNIGCDDGPAIDADYCVGMGYEVSLREGGRIIREVIRPAMDAARRAGVHVCHVEPDYIARKHPEAQELADPPSPSPAPARPFPPPAVPGWRQQMVARAHGADYATLSPYARMDRAAIVAPLPGEIYAYETAQLDRLLRRRGVENLIYTGFATDMCLLRAPGGIEPMLPYGYRLFVMRDATLGVEAPDVFEERLATRWAIRYFESHFGDTVTFADFVRACAGC